MLVPPKYMLMVIAIAVLYALFTFTKKYKIVRRDAQPVSILKKKKVVPKPEPEPEEDEKDS